MLAAILIIPNSLLPTRLTCPSRLWKEINRLSKKCEEEGFWTDFDNRSGDIIKWPKCKEPVEDAGHCCLTQEQWEATKCNKDYCKDPAKNLECNYWPNGMCYPGLGP